MPLLEILDVLRDARKVPDANVERVIQEMTKRLSEFTPAELKKLQRFALDYYNPGTRALLGMLLTPLPERGTAGTQGFAQSHHAFRLGHRARRVAGIPSLEHPVRLHEASDTYVELIQATANQIGIPAVHVEKDYWVTRVLKRLHESGHSETVVFKGGTSLSKAHRLIERFSEDVDLALKRDQGLSDAGAPQADQVDRT